MKKIIVYINFENIEEATNTEIQESVEDCLSSNGIYVEHIEIHEMP